MQPVEPAEFWLGVDLALVCAAVRQGGVGHPQVPLVRRQRVQGEELELVGVARHTHREDVQVGLTDPGDLENRYRQYIGHTKHSGKDF